MLSNQIGDPILAWSAGRAAETSENFPPDSTWVQLEALTDIEERERLHGITGSNPDQRLPSELRPIARSVGALQASDRVDQHGAPQPALTSDSLLGWNRAADANPAAVCSCRPLEPTTVSWHVHLSDLPLLRGYGVQEEQDPDRFCPADTLEIPGAVVGTDTANEPTLENMSRRIGTRA